MKKLIIAGGSFLFVVILLISVVSWFRGVQIQAATLKEQYNSSQKVIQTSHDNMWKTIKEKYNLADTYKDGFIESVNAVVEGRKGGSLFKSVNENMPGLSPDVYREVMATIEGKRDMLKRSMDTSIDIANSYNTFIQQGRLIPYSWIVGSERIEAKIITSGKTEDAWKSGQDNDTLIPSKPSKLEN